MQFHHPEARKKRIGVKGSEEVEEVPVCFVAERENAKVGAPDSSFKMECQARPHARNIRAAG